MTAKTKIKAEAKKLGTMMRKGLRKLSSAKTVKAVKKPARKIAKKMK